MSKQKKNVSQATAKAIPKATVENKESSLLPTLQKLLYPVFGIYILAVIIGVINHESWADEAQSWMVARDNSLISLFKHLPREGHPPLWYLILFPFAHAGLPYEVEKWIAAIITVSGVWLLMFRSKLPVSLKLLLPFTYVLFYEYPAFGRNYCLVILLLSIIISLYPKRFDKPWLYALAVIGLYNSHVLIITFCVGLTGLYLLDGIQYKKLKSANIGAFLLMCSGPLYVVFLTKAEIANHFGQYITDHAGKMSAAITGGILIEGNAGLALILFITITLLLIQRPKALLLALAGFAGVFYIMAYKYGGTTRHFAMLLVVLMGSYGIAEYYKNDAANILKNVNQNLLQWGAYGLCLVILLQLPQTISRYKTDMNELYSDARNAGDFIAGNFDKNSIIVGWQSTSCLSVMPYLPGRKLYMAEVERYGTYYVYDSAFMKEQWMNPVDYGVKMAHDKFPDKLDRLVFLFNYPVMPQSAKFLDLYYATSDTTVKWDERFYIYKFKENVR